MKDSNAWEIISNFSNVYQVNYLFLLENNHTFKFKTWDKNMNYFVPGQLSFYGKTELIQLSYWQKEKMTPI